MWWISETIGRATCFGLRSHAFVCVRQHMTVALYRCTRCNTYRVGHAPPDAVHVHWRPAHEEGDFR